MKYTIDDIKKEIGKINSCSLNFNAPNRKFSEELSKFDKRTPDFIEIEDAFADSKNIKAIYDFVRATIHICDTVKLAKAFCAGHHPYYFDTLCDFAKFCGHFGKIDAVKVCEDYTIRIQVRSNLLTFAKSVRGADIKRLKEEASYYGDKRLDKEFNEFIKNFKYYKTIYSKTPFNFDLYYKETMDELGINPEIFTPITPEDKLVKLSDDTIGK